MISEEVKDQNLYTKSYRLPKVKIYTQQSVSKQEVIIWVIMTFEISKSRGKLKNKCRRKSNRMQLYPVN